MQPSRTAADPPARPPRWLLLRGTLQQKLLMLVVLSVVPTAVFAFLLAVLHWQTHERLLAQSVQHQAATLAVTVEREVESVLARLRYVATSPFLAPAHLGDFHGRLREIVRASPDIENIVLLGADGEQIMNAAVPYGTELPRADDRPYQRSIYVEKAPAVSGVLIDPLQGAPGVHVGAPVVRNGEVAYILIASLDLKHFSALLKRRGMPEDGVAAVLDSELRYVARTRRLANFLGHDAPPALARTVSAAPQGGSQRIIPPDGPELWAAWVPLPTLGWTVVYGVPSAPGLQAQRLHLLLIFAGGAAILLAGVALALVLARELTRGLRALAERAPSLALGGTDVLPRVGIVEIDQLSESLEEASRHLAEEAARRSAAETERDRLLASEREAREAAEEANRGKDAFLALLGHELRNPTSAIANAAHLLGQAGASGENKSFAAAVIARQVRQLTRLVEDLLDVAKIAHGKLTVHYARVDMDACVRQAVDAVRESDRARGRELAVNVQPVSVIADAARLQQIIVNLLNNALAHTSAGGRIELSLRREGREAVLEVRDNGAGMEPHVIEHIFEPFYQAPDAGKARAGALGIGLTLVQRLVELHNGRVRAESCGRGTGSTFRVHLPLAPDAAEAAQESVPRAGGGSPREIVLVEDNDDVRETLRIALELSGHRVSAYGDGESALAGSPAHRPEVALVDIGLPGIDGAEVARVLRARSGGRIFVIALTGYGLPESGAEIEEARFDAHLLKPVNMDALQELLTRSSSAASPDA